ncbi:P-loop NTPase [Rhizobium sp. F40D2]|uniref:P-loop NTPase n=1 Tax=Rhizobium sp. F40D2 TaxID=3453141 RepID=UPI003F2153C3
MYTGWPATYADIVAGFTFKRTLASRIQSHLSTDFSLVAAILGASGVGKSTAAKQVLVECRSKGWKSWEHGGRHTLDPRLWEKVATNLKATEEVGVLFVDDAHLHLSDLNELIDRLAILDNAHLKILLASTRNHWHPRIKTGNLFRHGRIFNLSTLNDQEIDALLDMVERVPEIKRLAGNDFAGFDRSERRRRLTVRASKDMFVCLKNIYNTDSLDAIILQDFASLSEPLQDIFRYVAAMETAGINVHRQLVIRILGLPAQQVAAALEGLTDIVSEYDYHVRDGIFGWRCRHPVIAAIVTKFKFGNLDKMIRLFEDVIDNISPTFDIEVRSLRELCNTESGIPRIADKNIQNRLLAKMISRAPGERVPRHRLIRNLIEMHEFSRAETEIKLFEKDFGRDGPVHRYKIKYQVERAIHTPGILLEDRVAMLEQAHELAVVGAERYASNKNVLAAYAELGVEYYRLTGDLSYFDEAMKHLKSAEDKLGDPQITAIIVKFTRRVGGQSSTTDEELPEDIIPDADIVEREPEGA